MPCRLDCWGWLGGLLSGRPGLGLVWLAAMVVNRWVQAGMILGVMGDPQLGAECGDLSAAGYAGEPALGGELWGGEVLLSGEDLHAEAGGTGGGT